MSHVDIHDRRGHLQASQSRPALHLGCSLLSSSSHLWHQECSLRFWNRHPHPRSQRQKCLEYFAGKCKIISR